jgi:hypothetical protein
MHSDNDEQTDLTSTSVITVCNGRVMGVCDGGVMDL